MGGRAVRWGQCIGMGMAKVIEKVNQSIEEGSHAKFAKDAKEEGNDE